MAATWLVENDPFAQQEAKKYSSPIPSRPYILSCLTQAAKPMTHRQLSRAFGLANPTAIEALRRRLMAMENAGQVSCNQRNAYSPLDKSDLIEGKVEVHKDGYGFLLVSKEKKQQGEEDLYLAPSQVAGLWQGDLVLAQEKSGGWKGKREARIVEVLARGVETLVGRLSWQGGKALVTPDNPRLLHQVELDTSQLSQEEIAQLEEGLMLEVSISQHPSFGKNSPPVTGKLVSILGQHLEAGLEIELALRSHQLPHEWPTEVIEEVKQLPTSVTAADFTDRQDLTHLPFITIDGEDAKDFDDAIYAEITSSGDYKLWVAIADVSHYVQPDSPLDKEAFVRATSVYFPGRVIPMLPEEISNGLCSLQPNQQRLVLIAELNISQAGKVSGYQFHQGVIESKARLTYTQVGAWLEEPDNSLAQQLEANYPQALPPLTALAQIYAVLFNARQKRGAIDFDTRETQIIFTADKKIDQILPVERNTAHRLIEECMLAANVAAAKLVTQYELPSLFRVHEGPKAERLASLKGVLGELGLELGGGDQPTPKDYQSFFNLIAGRADAEILQTLLLRSMSQAVYSPDNQGHFGLAYTTYSHFTAPIRRYPDLTLHRLLHRLINTGLATSRLPADQQPTTEQLENLAIYSTQQLVELGEHCSMAERRADEATRDVTDWLKCEFMQDKLGEIFNAKVTSVLGFGLFVELEDFFIEGLIHISNLPGDYYVYEANRQRLKGERSGKTFKLGDRLTVQVAQVSLESRQIDLSLVESLEAGFKSNKKGNKTSKSKKSKPLKNSAKRAASKKSKKSSSMKVRAEKPAQKPKRQPRRRSIKK